MPHLPNSVILELKVSGRYLIRTFAIRSRLAGLLVILKISAVAIASYFINYAVDTRDNTSSATGAIYLAVAQGCFAVGRFSGSFFMHFVKPR